MSNLGFFTISGLACAGHTSETKEIWQSWLNEGIAKATQYGRSAVIKFAKEKGFQEADEKLTESTLAEKAFYYLLNKHPGASKSYIMRQAIINYS